VIALDTNLLVRLLTNDEPRQAAKVDAWLQGNAKAQTPAYVDHIVLCELAWVLESSYGYAREDVRTALAALLTHHSLKVEAPPRGSPGTGIARGRTRGFFRLFIGRAGEGGGLLAGFDAGQESREHSHSPVA
jgi:predicted nucleic-acid-binding protein